MVFEEHLCVMKFIPRGTLEMDIFQIAGFGRVRVMVDFHWGFGQGVKLLTGWRTQPDALSG